MKISFFCPSWGMVPDYVEKIDGKLETIFERIKLAGYDGVEMAIPLDPNQKEQIAKFLKDFDLKLIALQWAANGATLDQYLQSYEQHIKNAVDLKPVLINSHTGRDYSSFEDNDQIIKKSITLAKELGVKLLHETHRGRFTFHSATIQPYLKNNPELRLTADFSHWCNVSESYLIDQVENVENALERADHIHSRVGHPESPQVNDPRAPEWQEALNHHLNWWDKIVALHKQKGSSELTITSEFGPYPYMPTLPYTMQPVSSQWEINIWMKDFLKERYNR